MTPKNATTNASRTHCITSRLTRTCDLVAARWRSTTAPTRNEAPSPEQARAVLEAAHGGDLEALWAVALTTGLRQGELRALRWPEVDLDQGSLRVVASLVHIVASSSLGLTVDRSRLRPPGSAGAHFSNERTSRRCHSTARGIQQLHFYSAAGPSEDRERDARPLDGRDHRRRLLACDPGDASRGGTSNGSASVALEPRSRIDDVAVFENVCA